MPKTHGITLLGCGAVGGAVAELLLSQRQALASRSGCDLELRAVVVRDAAKVRPNVIPSALLTTDALKAVNSPKTDIVIELIGGVSPAREWTLAALAAGKCVVTANKALLALHGSEIFAAAAATGTCIAFEASVCGGIPLIESIRRGLIANEIDAVYGILNGTCNFILTRMSDDRVGYTAALADAQRLGYAEADPTLDIEGIDSAHKLAILASIALRQTCEFSRIAHRGISDIELTDLIAGEELGYVCKLLGIATRHDDGLDLSVQPTFIRSSHPLAGVRGPFNAVSVYGSAAGHTLFYGRGAGGLATAGAVVADAVDVACGNALRVFESYAVLPGRTPIADYRPAGERESAFYVRVGLVDRPGGMAAIAAALGDESVSIASLMQRQPHETHAHDAVPVVVVTHPTREKHIRAAIEHIERLDAVIGRVVCIPIMDEHAERNHRSE